jgi:hypothetical protein
MFLHFMHEMYNCTIGDKYLTHYTVVVEDLFFHMLSERTAIDL